MKKQKPKSDLPTKIKCVKCGKDCGVRPDVLEARIKLHGSLDQLLKEYFCRGCRKKNTYIVNDKPVIKKATTGFSKPISPLMRKVINHEMWWQKPGFVFPGAALRPGPVVSRVMTYVRDANGELKAVPVTEQSKTIDLPVLAADTVED